MAVLRNAATGVGRDHLDAWTCIDNIFVRQLVVHIVGTFGKRWQFDVRDVIQDVFVLARRDIGQFTPEGDVYASLKRWLFTIARNQALRRMQKAGRERPDEDAVEQAVAASSGASDARRLLGELMEDLSAEDRLLVTRHGLVGIAIKDLVPEIVEPRRASRVASP